MLTTMINIFQHLISSTFVLDVYGLMRRLLYPILSHHNLIIPIHWYITVLSQMGPYMAFSIIIQHYYQKLLEL